jgi:hypothetical protein
VLVVLFALERIILRFSGAPIDEALDEMPPPEIQVELEKRRRRHDAAEVNKNLGGRH